ncbi:MAG: hypothetical protein QGF90_14695, partial [Gammaproteobacteria bacterium]|nr:hypothetical protein [Gammaproteobacteria bacterium]
MTSHIKTIRLISFLAVLSISVSALADNHGDGSNLSSIKAIHSTNFGIDQSEIEQIKAAMQAAVSGGHIPGALLLVGN